MGDGEEQWSSDPRVLGIGFSSLCFLSVFSKCVLSLVRTSFSHVLSRWCSHSALNLSVEGGGGAGRDGR